MGTCLSKKRGSSSSSSSSVSGPKSSSPQPQTITLSKPKLETELHHATPKKKSLQEEDEGHVKKKKEIFIIKHRKSHEDRNGVDSEANVDAILLQCGRLSRNSSGKAASSSGERGRRRTNSASNNTSHDFDHSENTEFLYEEDDDDGVAGDTHLRRRHRRSPGPCSDQRRRTPSRERDQNQRSSSRERRVSRSPSRRLSDTHSHTTAIRPGKMVSVPPTVSSLSIDKSNNGNGGGGGGGIKRISVKRNVSAASPRSQSPARASGNAGNGSKVVLYSENQQQQPSLSRSSSRRAEQSPYRRNPLSEIDVDNNCKVQSRPRKESEAEANQKSNADTKDSIKIRTSSNKTKEQREEEEEVKGHSSMTENVVLDSPKPPPTSSLTRSRSSRRSRTDLDHILNPETIINPAHSYTSLLLEDIKNFHQKNNNNNNNTPSSSTPLPACVAKACSILEAVANLNSTSTSTNLTASSKNMGLNHYGKRNTDSSTKDTPFVESEVVVFDDVMEPSLHKYVTVTRDMEDKESSGSNSFSVSGQKHLGFSSSSSSLWEPNSGDSTDRWTCSTQLLSQQAHPRSRFI
ncbi:dentin sialophosphoprotein isoform X2 [Senna tora]|uniref:Dentin sialophosphoprotein isoform X2 n=1 Tax=Senna tora TaxID=362788 RepID=A0A834WEF2_9FABA|nr:dentin sialophosphoprotein isoform X2 [Senna tora]